MKRTFIISDISIYTVLAAFLFVLSGSASAQGITYISMLGTPNNAGFGIVSSNSWAAQAFQTGTAPGGYELDSIQVIMWYPDDHAAGFSLSLCGNNVYNGGGMGPYSAPGTVLGALSGSSQPSIGTNTYTASGIWLAPATTYWILLTSSTPDAVGQLYWCCTESYIHTPYISIDNWSIPALEGNVILTFVGSSDNGLSWGFPAYCWGQFAINATPAIPPALSIQPATNGVTLLWPVSAPVYRLQQSTNFANPSWVSNTIPVSVVNGTNQVTIYPSSGSLFFRLINP
jgi:hypothetical protein